MADAWKLKRVMQCKKCPWRVETDPRTIPNGYSDWKHQGLEKTIAKPGDLAGWSGVAMACHEEHDTHCIGWLIHQIGPGNNISLRIQMMSCENARAIKLRGEQHATFEDTLPETVRKREGATLPAEGDRG